MILIDTIEWIFIVLVYTGMSHLRSGHGYNYTLPFISISALYVMVEYHQKVFIAIFDNHAREESIVKELHP